MVDYYFQSSFVTDECINDCWLMDDDPQQTEKWTDEQMDWVHSGGGGTPLCGQHVGKCCNKGYSFECFLV